MPTPASIASVARIEIKNNSKESKYFRLIYAKNEVKRNKNPISVAPPDIQYIVTKNAG